MSESFKVPEKLVTVLKNFSQLNPSLAISSERVEVISQHKTCLGRYVFDESLPIDEFIGLFDTSEFLSIISIYKSPDITQYGNKYITISEGNSKVKYGVTVKELLPKVVIQNKYAPDDIDKQLQKVGGDVDFILSAEKLTMILKTSSLLKADWIFFESEENGIRVTVGDSLDSSNNTWDMVITGEDVKINKLENAIKLAVNDLRLIPSDYEVTISCKGMSSWKSVFGVDYFICTMPV